MQKTNLVDNLDELMDEFNLNVAAVAKYCEVNPRTVYFWLDGRNKMSKSHYALLLCRLTLEGKDVKKHEKNLLLP